MNKLDLGFGSTTSLDSFVFGKLNNCLLDLVLYSRFIGVMIMEKNDVLDGA